jgi:hypothetical protein
MINSNNKKCIKTGFVLHILSTNMITNVDLFCDEKGNAYVNDNAKIHYKRIYPLERKTSGLARGYKRLA